ncbi:hypothetical protein FRC08_008433 [Ceratobasidium sp. 394]|nr:hypothetical protein FRC08_008433 [Ceratobasidium sp. 394]
MPRRATSGAGPSSHEKPKPKYKPYNRKSNYPNTNPKFRRQNASSSNPETPTKRYQPPTRASSERSKYRSSQAEPRPPPPPRLKRQKSFLQSGIFGEQREGASISLVRRLDRNVSKGKVPDWLSNACDDLPPRHPLRTNATSPGPDPAHAEDNDDNPFAFQPPSPPQTHSVDEVRATMPPQPRPYAPRPRIPIRRMKLSSMAPQTLPVFTELVYQEDYYDTSMPLNDFIEVASPHPFDNNQLLSPDLSPAFDPFPTNQHPISPRTISSPLFVSDIRSTSPRLPQLSPVPPTFPFSSDDTTIPTPPHNSIYSPEQDEIQGALTTQHPFVTSVYATSPTLGGLPLKALVGSYSSSRAQTSSPLLGPTWSNSPRFSAHTLPIQLRPDSADVYKARLLAYATAAADQLSSTSGDEVLAYRRWGGMEAVVDDPHDGATEVATYGTAPDDLVGELSQDLFTQDTAGGFTQEARSQSPPHVDIPPVYQSPGVSHLLEPIAEALSEADDEDLPDSDNFDQFDVELFEDWRDEPMEDDLEEGGMLAPEIRDEEDELAADEPPEEEVSKIPAGSPGGSTIPLAQVKVEPGAGATSKRNRPIAPFPVSISRRTPDSRDAPAKPETMTKLSPKFVAQPARRVRPSPFAHLLKNRWDQASSVEGTTQGGPEDEIESWPA